MKNRTLTMILLSLLLAICTYSIAGSLENKSKIAGNRYYVDANGSTASDDNPGSVDKPWKSLAKVGDILKPGDKLIIKPGTYYGSVKLNNSGEPGKPIIIEGSSLGDVIITGSLPVAAWKPLEKDSTVWEAEYKHKLWRLHPGIHSKHYEKSEPADLTMDGTPLFWSDDKNLLPGTWTVDKKAKKVYARLSDDIDPNTRSMELVSESNGLMALGDDIIIRNLVLRRFVRGFYIKGKRIKLENNFSEWNAYDGVWISPYASNSNIKNNVIKWNGMGGMGMSPGGRIANNKILFNNWKLNSPYWHSAGLKAVCLLGGLIEENEAAYNAGLGIWLDYGNNIDVKNNISHDNATMGLEREAGHNGIWTGNVSFRNRYGFMNYSSCNILLKENIFSDNKGGIQYQFRRTRIPGFKPKWIKRKLKTFAETHSKEVAHDWLMNYITYGFPCFQFRNNVTENNLLLNNGINFISVSSKQLPDPKEKWIISDNTFKSNILVNSDPKKMIGGFSSLAQYKEKTKDGQECLSLPKLDLSKLPDWARKLYNKHRKLLTYPRMRQSITNIYDELKVQNGWCYNNYPAPAGLLALARICESKTLKEKKFSDPALKAYYIDYKNKNTLVLWRTHGRAADFVPVLLKGIPEEATLETSWGKKLPFQRKNDLVSINVGTWPLYIVGCDENIMEVSPFSLKMPEKLTFGQAMEIVIEDPVGTGLLYIDKYQGVERCPDRVTVKDKKTVFSLTLLESAKNSFVEFRIAGHLGGLYSGRMIRFFTGKSGGRTNQILKNKGFTPISLASVGNCGLGADSDKDSIMAMGKLRTLKNLPEKIKLGEIPFVVGKGLKACIGFNSNHAKGKRRPDFIRIDLGGKKYKALAFLQTCAWAPKKIGVPLLKYTLNYDDNLVESTYVKNGINVLDWWHAPNKSQQKILKSNETWKAWSGDCGDGNEVHVYAYVWKNPKPDVGVNSLQISTADPDKNVLMGILAISLLEDKKK